MPPPMAPRPINPIVSVMGLLLRALLLSARAKGVGPSRRQRAQPLAEARPAASRLSARLIRLRAQPHLAQNLFDLPCALHLLRHEAAGARAGDVFGKVIEE